MQKQLLIQDDTYFYQLFIGNAAPYVCLCPYNNDDLDITVMKVWSLIYKFFSLILKKSWYLCGN